ncbi:MAG TPA: D-alanine--D-alanine ligase [Lachnospiraceae bacterium]|nr:D-alanine--D-alanine ligase [Lachnospiraceae bacterium]
MKIIVLCGGLSTERDVSLVSGSKVFEALKDRGHKVIILDVFMGYRGEVTADIFDRDIDWFGEIPEFDASDGRELPGKSRKLDISEVKALREVRRSGEFFGQNVLELCRLSDIVFMALHGDCGENGKIQAAFDLCGIKYTGTDSLSSALAMDKALSKHIFFANGIRTPEYHVLRDENEDYEPEFPCVVKVNSGGSSVGVYIVKTMEEYKSALKGAFSYEKKVLVEKYIQGREFTDCVIEGMALPVVEIAPKSGFYDYKNKYEAGATVETCPADIPKELTERIQEAAVKAFNALEIKTYARMDFIVNGEGEVYCLEANTLPGMTPTSLIPQEAAAIGKSFGDLCEWIIDISLQKHEIYRYL